MKIPIDSKNLINLLIAMVAGVALLFIHFSHRQDLNHIEKETKSKIIDQQFAKKRNDVERLFALTYQTVRTVSLLPSVRSISGSNRENEDIDVVKEGRFSREGKLTVQQLYNNLASNISVSEVYAVLSNFDPSKGEVPFFMYDEILLSQKAKEEVKKVLESDIPEESEKEEYIYYVQFLAELAMTPPKFQDSNSIDWIPGFSSQSMRTCDNTQYESVSKGNLQDASGIIYSVPFFSNESSFKGLISAVIRLNVIEALLMDVPNLLISKIDIEKNRVEGWKLPKEASHFVLVNRDSKIAIYDRRNENNNKNTELRDKYLNLNLSQANTTNNFYYEKLNIRDNKDWFLVYDFAYQPWLEAQKASTQLHYIKIFAIIFILGIILLFRLLQTRNMTRIRENLVANISKTTESLLEESDAAKQNSHNLESMSVTLENSTNEMASTILQIETTATKNVTFTIAFQKKKPG